VHEYGISENARQNVLEAIFETIKEYPTKSSDNLTESMTLKECSSRPIMFASTKFWDAMDYFDSSNIPQTQKTQEEIQTIEIRFLKFLPHTALFTVVFLVTTLLTLGYIAYFGTSWRLIWFIPFSLFASFLFCTRMVSVDWKNPDMTLGELADKIVALHCEGYIRMTGEENG
jgi:hypothetical protein